MKSSERKFHREPVGGLGPVPTAGEIGGAPLFIPSQVRVSFRDPLRKLGMCLLEFGDWYSFGQEKPTDERLWLDLSLPSSEEKGAALPLWKANVPELHSGPRGPEEGVVLGCFKWEPHEHSCMGGQRAQSE